MTKMKTLADCDVAIGGAVRTYAPGKTIEVDGPTEVRRLELNGKAERVAALPSAPAGAEALGGGWYRLPDGTKIRGAAAAAAAAGK